MSARRGAVGLTSCTRAIALAVINKFSRLNAATDGSYRRKHVALKGLEFGIHNAAGARRGLSEVTVLIALVYSGKILRLSLPQCGSHYVGFSCTSFTTFHGGLGLPNSTGCKWKCGHPLLHDLHWKWCLFWLHLPYLGYHPLLRDLHWK